MKKGYLSGKNELELKPSRFWYSLIFGLFSAITIYSFFCLIRLVFRSMDLGFSNGPLILGSSGRYWQNFNLAIVAILLSNFLFMGSLFKKPLQSRIGFNRRNEIMNNQVFLGFNFFYFFTKIFMLLGAFSMVYFDYRLLSEYVWAFVLLGIVFFLESWKTVLRVFGRRIYKMFLLSFAIISILPFLFAFTSVFDFQSVDRQLLAKNPPISLPYSEYRVRPNYLRNSIKVSLEGDEILYYLNNNLTSFRNIRFALQENRTLHYYDRNALYLMASADLPIGDLKRLEKLLFLINESRVFYVTQRVPPKRTGRFDLYGVPKQLYFTNVETLELEGLLPANLPLPPARPEFTVSDTDSIININLGNNVRFEDKIVAKIDLHKAFKNAIPTNVIFNLVYQEDITYQQYVTVYSNYKSAIDELRAEHLELVMGYDDEFRPTNRQEFEKRQLEVWRQFPMKLLENWKK